MLNTNFKSIVQIAKAFEDPQVCINYLEKLRWHGNVISPFDPYSKVYKCKDNKYRCKNTGKYFNVKTDTMFDSSKISLKKWFMAIWLITSHKKDISSINIAEEIDVTQKTAWFLNQRIRNCFGMNSEDINFDGTVEGDEAFVVGSTKPITLTKKLQTLKATNV